MPRRPSKPLQYVTTAFILGVVLSGCLEEADCDPASAPISGTLNFAAVPTTEEVVRLLDGTGWTVSGQDRAEVSAMKTIPHPTRRDSQGNVASEALHLNIRVLNRSDARLTILELRATDLKANSTDEARSLLAPHLAPVRDRFAAEFGQPSEEHYNVNRICGNL